MAERCGPRARPRRAIVSGQRSLIALVAHDRGPDELVLEPARSVGSDVREIAVVDRPRQEVDFVHGADERWAPADRLLHLHRRQGEIGEARGEVLAGLVDVIGRTVMEQVPDHLDPGALGGLQRRQPARPVVIARRFFDQMPAQAIADRAETELSAQLIILQHMLVVAGRPDEVEANAVAPPVRRTFEAGLKEAREPLAEWVAHGRAQCMKDGKRANFTAKTACRPDLVHPSSRPCSGTISKLMLSASHAPELARKIVARAPWPKPGQCRARRGRPGGRA